MAQQWHKTFNGREQVAMMAKLMNSEEELGGIRIGDAVRLPSIDITFEVVGFSDDALVDLRAPSGRLLKAGWRALTRVRTRRPEQ